MGHSLAAHGLCTCGHDETMHELVVLEQYGSIDFIPVGRCEATGCNCEQLDLNDTKVCMACEPEEAPEWAR